MTAPSEDGGVSQRRSASAPVFDLKELFFSPCLPSTHPMTFARSLSVTSISVPSDLFVSARLLNIAGMGKKKKKKLFQCFSKRHLNTSNKGSSA